MADTKRSITKERLERFFAGIVSRIGTEISGKADKTAIGNARVFYATCSTAAGTQRKDVTISGLTALQTGDVLIVQMANNQTYNGVPTLRVNSLTAANIQRKNGTNAARYEWRAGEMLTLVWNGTYFVLVDGDLATTSYVGLTLLQSSATSTKEDRALTPASLNNLVLNMISGVALYSASATYAVGDLCRYGYYIYRCITAITTAEAWNAEHWEIVDPLLTQIQELQEPGFYVDGDGYVCQRVAGS